MQARTAPLVLDDCLILLVGFGSEYSLGPFERFLATTGLDFLACDLQNNEMPVLSKRPSILVTSQHPSTTSAIFNASWGRSPPFSNYIAPDRLLARLSPEIAVFVPHDLEAPIRADEIAYMGMFDLYCSPVQVNPALERLCKSIHTGWIKHNAIDSVPEATRELVSQRGVFFVNQIAAVLAAGGMSHLRANYPSVFVHGIPIKLPQWPGTDEMVARLRAEGVPVIESSAASTPIIAASPRIFVNAAGSVVAEAKYIGTPVVMLDQRGELGEAPPPGERRQVPYFNFELLLATLSSMCANRYS